MIYTNFSFAQILDSFNISIVKQSFIIPYTKIQYLFTLDDANETFSDSSLTFPYDPSLKYTTD
jgi:hypothetical protein